MLVVPCTTHIVQVTLQNDSSTPMLTGHVNPYIHSKTAGVQCFRLKAGGWVGTHRSVIWNILRIRIGNQIEFRDF